MRFVGIYYSSHLGTDNILMTQVPTAPPPNGAMFKRKTAASVSSRTFDADNASSVTMGSDNFGSDLKQQHKTGASAMVISVNRTPQQGSRAPTRNFQQYNDNGGDTQSQAGKLSMVLGEEPRKLVQVDFLSKQDSTAVGNNNNNNSLLKQHREDASIRAIALANQRKVNNHGANQSLSNYNPDNDGVSTISMSVSKPANYAQKGIAKSDIAAAYYQPPQQFQNYQQQQQTRGEALTVAQIADGAVFARVATVAGMDGLAHFEKDDYERFVEDRQRAILFGTLPNRLEDAAMNAAFSIFINKLKQLELSQRANRQPTVNNNLHNQAAAATQAALALQHRLEVIDDEEDYVTYPDPATMQQQQGRQAGGQNQVFRRLSRPQTRAGTSLQTASKTGKTLQPQPNQQQKTTKQPALQLSMASGATVLTGQSIGGVQQLNNRTMTPHSNGKSGRNSTLPQQQQQPAAPQQTVIKKLVSYQQQPTGSMVSGAPPPSVYPFPPPADILYNLGRPNQASSKLSLPILPSGASAKQRPQKLKLVNVGGPQRLKLADTVGSTFSTASTNH